MAFLVQIVNSDFIKQAISTFAEMLSSDEICQSRSRLSGLARGDGRLCYDVAVLGYDAALGAALDPARDHRCLPFFGLFSLIVVLLRQSIFYQIRPASSCSHRYKGCPHPAAGNLDGGVNPRRCFHSRSASRATGKFLRSSLANDPQIGCHGLPRKRWLLIDRA
jgi:hypothetical protein